MSAKIVQLVETGKKKAEELLKGMQFVWGFLVIWWKNTIFASSTNYVYETKIACP